MHNNKLPPEVFYAYETTATHREGPPDPSCRNGADRGTYIMRWSIGHSSKASPRQLALGEPARAHAHRPGARASTIEPRLISGIGTKWCLLLPPSKSSSTDSRPM